MTKRSGGCLCGAVQFTANNMSKEAGACHCNMCRKWGGAALMVVDCGSEVSFEDDKNISVFDSSEWGERGFCSRCGSHLFYKLKQNQQYMMPVGLFEDDEDLIFEHQVFIEEKPAYYSFSNETKNMTGEELFAQFSSSSD